MSLPDLLALERPDRDVIAKQIAKSKRRGYLPSADLAAALTSVQITDRMRGSSTLEVTFDDERYVLSDSGLFDPGKDGFLDPIEVNYPHGSKYWWCLTMASPSSSEVLTLSFMERAAADLLLLTGPVKVRRAKRTRAEFIKWLTSHVKRHGGIDFHCRELHTKDPVTKPKAEADRESRKDQGINRSERVTIKGVPASHSQISQVERALDVASDVRAPELATIALLCAGIGESSFRAVMNTAGSGYGGVFQGDVAARYHYFDVNDTEGMARCFLKGGQGFQAEGAIKLVQAGVRDPGEIATRVEASGQPASFYSQHRSEAEALLEAYGGISPGARQRKQVNFEVGVPGNSTETFWDAMNRLAEEVNWALFLDGNDCYYDAEETLIKQKPVAVIKDNDASVLDWDYQWDARAIATEMSLTLICEPFEFRAGQVFKLVGFGPASVSTTVGLPGRWLVSEVERDDSSLASTFTLKQPVDLG